MSPNVFIVAGEASADLHAGNLLKELKILYPNLKSFGVGGEALSREGMEIIVPASSLSLMGVAEWMDKVPAIWGSFQKLTRLVKERKPDVAILLDLPDFNLMLAGKLKKIGVPVVYYISPQVWAWRKYRIHKIKKRVDKMLTLFPFEKSFYHEYGVDAEFVGHPLLDHLFPSLTERSQTEVLQGPRLAVLPGSRGSELRYHTPILLEFLEKLQGLYPGLQVQIPVASTLEEETFEKFKKFPAVTLTHDSWKTLRWADVAVVASGTATLETALMGVPFCLFYRVSFSSAWVFKNLIRYKGFIGMPNVLLGKKVVPELFQEAFTATALLEEVRKLISIESHRKNVRQDLLSTREKLGTSGANQRAALEIREVLEQKSTAYSHAPVLA